MRLWCAQQLRRLLTMVEGDFAVVLLVPRDALYRRAVVLCDQFETLEHNGERRRHQVFAQLLKEVDRHELPPASKRAVALAIEAAVGG